MRAPLIALAQMPFLAKIRLLFGGCSPARRFDSDWRKPRGLARHHPGTGYHYRGGSYHAVIGCPRRRSNTIRRRAQPIPQAAFSRKPMMNKPPMFGGRALVLSGTTTNM